LADNETHVAPPPAAPDPINADARSLYQTPVEATKAIQERFLYWTGKLTDTSLQLCFAVIAANWAVFKTTDDILKNRRSRASIALVILGMGCNLVATFLIGKSLSERGDYAEADLSRWQNEYSQNVGKPTPWPYSEGSIRLSRIARYIKLWVPILGGATFLVALFRNH
jgi:hypothetical protein